MKDETVFFREEQRHLPLWVYPLIAPPVVLAWWFFVREWILGIPLEARPAPAWLAWVVFLSVGVGLPLLLATLRLKVVMRKDELWFRYFPFWAKIIPLSEISSCEMRRFRPLRDYGGWGLKGTPWAGMSYTVRGNKGAQLVLKNGKRILIGSQRAEELAAAIKEKISSV